MIYYLRAYCKDFVDHPDIIQYTLVEFPLGIYPYITFDRGEWLIVTSPFREIVLQ